MGFRTFGAVATALALMLPAGALADTGLDVMLVTEDGRLHAYDPATLAFEGEGETATITVSRQTLVEAGDDLGIEPLGEACADPSRPNHVVVGTGGDTPGWAYLRISGDAVGSLTIDKIGLLHANGLDPSPYGCQFLPDGRLITSVVGDRDPMSGLPSGALILWWPPFDGTDPAGCVLLSAIGQAGGLGLEADGNILFTAGKYDRRGNMGGVFRLTGDLPATVDACEAGEGMPTASGLGQFVFITDPESSTPWDISPTAAGGWFVSNPYTGTITEYDAGGMIVRRAVGNGSSLPGGFIEQFTPYGHALAPNGDLWIAMYGLSDLTTAADGAAQVHVAPLSTRGEPDPTGDRNFIAGSGGKSRITREMNRTQGVALVTLHAAASQGTDAAPTPEDSGEVAAAPAPAPDSGTLPTTGGGLALLGLLVIGAALWLRRRP